MTSTLFTPARLAANQLERIRSFEARTGRILLAFQSHEQPLAPLSESEKEELQALENDLGVVMVAYSKDT